MDKTSDTANTVHNGGIELPKHDFEGLSKVVQQAKTALNTVPATENGFMPLEGFDPKKPYEDIARNLEAWQTRLNGSPLSPEQTISELKKVKSDLRGKLDAAHAEHIRILEATYRERTTDLTTNHDKLRGLIEASEREWKSHAKEIETKLETALVNYCNQRINDLGTYHDKIERELREQLVKLENRERELQGKVDDLETERHRWLDERRDWLKERENKFDEEKQKEREAFTLNRRQIIQNEHRDNVDATASEIYARKFSFGQLFATVLLAVAIIAVAVVIIAESSRQSKAEPPNLPKSPTVSVKIDTTIGEAAKS